MLTAWVDRLRQEIILAAGSHVTPFSPADLALNHLDYCEEYVLEMLNPETEED